MVLSNKRAYQVLTEIISFYPDAQPSLNFSNRFELLISVILSAQTTDVAVNKVTPALFAAYPGPEKMSKAEISEIEFYISKIGLYRNKARFLKSCSQQLLDNYDGEVPSTRKDLEGLVGVGRKTANVVMSVGFGIPAFAVDTHIERICKHHRIVQKSATTLEIERRVTNVLPPSLWVPAHQAMICFGRDVCRSQNPGCYKYPQLFNCADTP